MASPNTDDELIIIRCPSCSERFKVEEEFIGSMVECGGCEHQFEITHDHVIKGKKFYPGENKDSLLNQFHRSESHNFDSGVVSKVAPQQHMPSASDVEPTSPVRVFLGLMGGLSIALMAMILMLGAERGAMLDGVTTEKRVIMASFVAFIAFILIVSANPKTRVRATLIGLIAAGGLVSIPFFFTDASIPIGSANPTGENDNNRPSQNADGDTSSVKMSQEELSEIIGMEPLEAEIQRLALSGSKKRAIGIWFKNLRGSNRYLVRDYIVRVTGADLQSHYYPRGNGSYLMVVTGITQSLKEMNDVMLPIGEVANTYEGLQVIEVLVDNNSFKSGPIEKLTNPKDPMFYHLNNDELKSIDLDRISAAVNRLAEAEPSILRSDITRQLVYLMKQDWVDFKDDVAAALSVWAQQPNPASAAALEAAKKIHLDGKEVPLEIMELVVQKKNMDVIPLLNLLWEENPSRWELLYQQVGTAAEDLMLQNLSVATGVHRDSAIKVLGAVGGAQSLDAISALDQSKFNGETKVLIRNAIQSIRKRAEP